MGTFKALLVYPNLQMVALMPSNIALLSACLKKAGIEVRLFDTTLYRTAEKSVDDIRVEHMQLRPFNLKEKGVDYKDSDVFEDFEKMVREYKPDIIAVSATDDTFDLGIALVAKIRHLGIHVTVGGIYPTFSPDESINNENLDSICLGEGEEALVELCLRLRDGLDISTIPNLWIKKNGFVCKNPMRPLIDVDKIPYEDFDIFEEKRFFRPMQGKIYRMIPVTIDRGCPFSCSFCAAPLQRKFYANARGGGYFRTKSTQRVITELQYHIEKYKADYIYFNSETFFARKEDDIEAFAQEYSAKIGLPFWCQTRIETITEERIKLLEDMNCDRLSIGLEHGNEEFRKKVLNKHFTNRQVIEAFKILDKSRIPVTVNNIIGFPDETRKLVFDTIKLNRSIKADSINAYFFVPYRGTPLRTYCIEKRYLDSATKTDSLMKSSILRMPHFPPEEIKGLIRTFPLYVKMPETYFDRIRMAEKLDVEGDSVLAELRDLYFREYFR